MALSENTSVQEASQMEDHSPPSTSEPSQIFNKVLNLDMFEIDEKKLGKGKFARVYHAKDRETELEYALKTMKKTDLHYGKVEEQARGSIKIQSEIDHPNVLKVFGNFEDDSKIYVLMELSREGSLYDLAQKNTKVPEPQAAKLIAQLAQALTYIHGKNIIHRDINPENVLIGADGEIKVSGFIWSKPMVDGRSSGLCGLLDYLAPELLTGAETYDTMVDVWCLGVMTFELLVGRAPFEDNVMMTQKRIKSLDMEVPSSVSPEATDLIHKVMLHS
jgi:aurora kinase